MEDDLIKKCPKCKNEITHLVRTHWGTYKATSTVYFDGEEIEEKYVNKSCQDDEHHCPECKSIVNIDDI